MSRNTNYENKETNTLVGGERRYVVDANGFVTDYSTYRKNPRAYTGTED